MRRGPPESIMATGHKVSRERRLSGRYAYVVCHDRQMGKIAESDDARERNGALLQHLQGNHAVFSGFALPDDEGRCEDAGKH